MGNDDAPHRFTLILPKKLAADLKRAAKDEFNTSSALARRLITTGLRAQNAQRVERDSDKQSR